VAVNPDWIYVIEGPAIADLVAQVEQGELWTEIAPGVRSAASSLIMTNNIQVMFLTFAGGLTAGLLTFWVLLSNGMHLGAIFGLLIVHDLAWGLAEFIVAHGVVELSVIFLAGGCGLYVGDGLLRPGLASRKDLLIQRTHWRAVDSGSAFPAGLIEGFQPVGSARVKAAVGALSGTSLAYWLGVANPRKYSDMRIPYERTAYHLPISPCRCFVRLDELPSLGCRRWPRACGAHGRRRDKRLSDRGCP
jgi:uncharacterized membrane protein SpoIIM required for sporulation